ncbi:hypothetical protein [Egicoccus sp. AB-alg6-2]|uniref:hypothetical protein n=1 Tax=Egicoccus sp. AB-alg6-2 TaxID=3242692 RepID=UPI00359D5674
MSDTTPTPSITAEDVHLDHPVPWHPLARLGGPVTVVLGSVLAAVGMALHLPAMAEDLAIPMAIADAPTRWLGSHLLMGFGFALVAVGAGSHLAVLRGDRGATVTAMGIVATTLGAITMALGDVAHGAVGFALTAVDPATSFEAHEAYFAHPAILGINTGPLLISVGMLVLGAGLLRSGVHPRWIGVVIMLTPVAVNAAFNLALPTLLHGVPFAAGMSVFAYAMWRTPRPLPTGVANVTR